ncbi:MAG: leucyl aminopeptidase family protein [Planctomycetes bacterium]|nr:leucyl aminopeptidase family protein [Planctomycetota bacterium]
MNAITTQRSNESIPIHPLKCEELAGWLERAEPRQRLWVESSGFQAKAATHLLLPGPEGELVGVLAGVAEPTNPWVLSHLPGVLPKGAYHVEAAWSVEAHECAALGWALAAYRFARYKKNDPPEAVLALHPAVSEERLAHVYEAITLVRELVSTPAEDMGPAELSAAARDVAAAAGATFQEIVGSDLLTRNFPAIHAVGRASAEEPRLIDVQWGDESHPRLTLVGKGVCFDSGGLDLKSAEGMRLMKKDMGGAAHALGLASLIMSEGLPVRLRLLIAAVENAVSGNAYRPGDVIRARNGKTIEIGNTDAEGRVILSDTLVEASAEHPDLILDFATLTGAARVALGTDVPALFTNRDDVAEGLLRASARVADPLWRMPLHEPYRDLIQSAFADVANMASTSFGGSITAALFLQEFVDGDVPWAHFDVMAWNTKSRPGRPEGGEAMGLRAAFAYLSERYRKG